MNEHRTRDTIVYSSCTFLLGLVIGSFLIGPRLARMQPAAAPEAAESQAASPAAGAGGSDPMPAVRQQLEELKQKVAANPQDAVSLARLGAMYMQAAKYPQAIDYFERALAVAEDPGVRMDLTWSYRQAGRVDDAKASLARLKKDRPDDPDVRRLEEIMRQ